jgi:hypothetical protein
VVRQFEMMGVYSVNESVAISRSRDKLRSMQLLARRDIGMPVTGFAHSPDDIPDLIDMVGGAPLVVKLLEGTQGVGVVLAETRKAAESVIEAFLGIDVDIMVQEFIAESRGTDVRCFIVGDKVVAAMQRTGKPGEFRSNLHRGGTAELAKITPTERRTAVRAASGHGPERGRRRSDPLQPRAAGARGQQLAGPRGHRKARVRTWRAPSSSSSKKRQARRHPHPGQGVSRGRAPSESRDERPANPGIEHRGFESMRGSGSPSTCPVPSSIPIPRWTCRWRSCAAA